MLKFNYDFLKGKIVEKFGTRKAFANALSLSERSLSLKLNNKIYFSQSEIRDITSLLEMDEKDIPTLFFKLESSKI